MAHTVCIAALCQYEDGKHCVILCSDTRIETEGVGSSVLQSKARLLSPQFIAMFAGTVPKAKELLDRCAYHLRREADNITQENIIDELRKPFDAQNRVDVSEYISSTLGMTYRKFEGLKPDDQHAALGGFVKRDVDAIITWLGCAPPRIFTVGAYGVAEAAQFSCIGCGWQAAQASLFSRKYAPDASFEECLYYVYEAKRNSESVPGVGADTYLLVVEPHIENNRAIYHRFSERRLSVLSGQYETFGPRPFAVSHAPDRIGVEFLGLPKKADNVLD